MSGTPVFLLGTGRSGTTLVQRLLNSYPDVLIWGEHAGYLHKLAQAYDILTKSPSMEEFSYSVNESIGTELNASIFKDPERWQAWNNWFKKDDIRSIFRQHIEEVFNPAQVGQQSIWGFKEIRYGVDDNVLEFLIDLFPDGKFLFVVRNGLNTVESQLNTFYKGKSRHLKVKRIIQLPIAIRIARLWSRQNLRFKSFAQSHPDNSCLLRYEDIIRDPEHFQMIFDFIGRPVTHAQKEILEMKSGRGTGFGKETDENERWKRLGPIPIVILRRIVKRTSRELGY